MHKILIYGGAFDPIHNGHLNTAIHVQQHFQFDQFIFIPCKEPLLKPKSSATALQRVDMLNLALKPLPEVYRIDRLEIERIGPSYMVITLETYRRRFGHEASITLLMGEDAFLTLPDWYQWGKIISLANILVIKRPGVQQKPSALLKTFLTEHIVDEEQEIGQHSHGCVCLYDAGYYDMASSALRKAFAEGSADMDTFIPKPVLDYIKKNQLYTSS